MSTVYSSTWVVLWKLERGAEASTVNSSTVELDWKLGRVKPEPSTVEVAVGYSLR